MEDLRRSPPSNGRFPSSPPSTSLYPDPYASSTNPASSNITPNGSTTSPSGSHYQPASPMAFYHPPYSQGLSSMFGSPSSPGGGGGGGGGGSGGHGGGAGIMASGSSPEAVQAMLQSSAAQLDSRLNLDSAYPEIGHLVQSGLSLYLTICQSIN
jgi:hypothetical protein